MAAEFTKFELKRFHGPPPAVVLIQQWFSSGDGKSHLGSEKSTLKSGKLLGLVCSFGFRYTDYKSSRIT